MIERINTCPNANATGFRAGKKPKLSRKSAINQKFQFDTTYYCVGCKPEKYKAEQKS